MKKYQVGYRLPDGKVRYCPLTHSEGMEYNSLQSGEARTEFIKQKIDLIKIHTAMDNW